MLRIATRVYLVLMLPVVLLMGVILGACSGVASAGKIWSDLWDGREPNI